MNPEFECLSTLVADQRFELLRVRDTGSGAALLLKRSRRSATADVAADSAALQRELALARELSSAATLQPRWRAGKPHPQLTMADPGGELLARHIEAQRLPLQAVLALAAQLAQTLAQLHRRGWLHNGVRPQSILWRGDDSRGWFIDLAEATAGAQIAPAAALPGSAARLVYLAPEQTGRIERSADARSDLYALGVVLYELLTGAPPFRSDDALEQIHWHIAGSAPEPAQLDPRLPAVLSQLVMKLLAKAPEDRYQSATSLAHDLALCAQAWAERRQIEPFTLGRRDAGGEFVVSPKLQGREHEVQVLLEAFDAVCEGRGGASMLLVEGYSGIGKTALIQQLVRPIVRRKGHFISGKFDQVVRGVPFGALIQAFRGLMRQMLAQNEAQLGAWREALSGALGGNGGVIAEVIPEIEFIIGAQPVPAALTGVEAQNRFQRVLQQFVAALARPEHPLLLFLDDLQWADAATLGLLEPLLASPDIRGLMLVGAYRDNELDASPRLASTLAALDAAGIGLKRVSLGPLQPPDLVRLVAESLHASAEQAEPLARLVHHKTGGNPFFVIQFLKALARDGLLRFDEARGSWLYRIEQIADAPLADNVVELMTRGIQRLPPQAQYALTLAACIGNRFDVRTLATVSEQSLAATADDLARAVAEGLIVKRAQPQSDEAAAGATASFAFLHDRVQQAAYALIPEQRRQRLHLMVGRLRRARASAEQLDAEVFDIVHHLNLGRGLITDRDERQQVAALNLAAGRRASSSAAHDSALELFRAGTSLLDEDDWAQRHELSFELHLEAAESEYLCGQFDAALERIDGLMAHAATPIERARGCRLRSVMHENMARYDEALASARQGLALLGVSFAAHEADNAAALEEQIARIDELRGGREIGSLVDLPVLRDAEVRMVMSMLTDIWSAAYILGDATLARLISATMVRLSLQHGNVEESAYGYVTHAITVGPVRGDYRAAYEFGRLALAVNERFGDTRRRAKIYQQFHAHVNLWCRPFHSCADYAREACRSGLDSGDFLYAAYGAGTASWSAIAATQDLAQFIRDQEPSVALIERLKNRPFADSVRLLVNWARALQGTTLAPLSFSDAGFDEAAYLRDYRDNPFFACIHAVARQMLCGLLGTPAQALQAARHAATLVGHVPGTVWPVLHEFWYGLALAANVEAAPAGARAGWMSQLDVLQRSFQARAAHCAENFECQARLLAAEMARLEGRDRDALDGYERTIEFAAAHALLQHGALAHELLARLRLARGDSSLAALHLAQARDLFARWGAAAKADALERSCAALTQRHPDRTAAPPQAAPPLLAAVEAGDGLDWFSVLKATQAIAGEVEAQRLLARLLQIAVENAGAERGALVLEGPAGPTVQASEAAAAEASAMAQGEALQDSARVPVGIVNIVRRTGDSVVLTRSEVDEQHGADPYIAAHRPRSIACVPVSQLGRSVGVLYLEHRRVDALFTPRRLRTLRVLVTQAAISLENAQLVAGLKQEIAERREAQQQLGVALADVSRLKDEVEAENSYLRRDLIANVSHDLRTPLVSMRGYLEVLARRGDGLSHDQRRQYLDIAVRQSEHLSALVDELFELAKLDFKGTTLNCEPFAFGELAADVLRKFQLAAEAKRVALQFDSPPQLPFVRADLALMERVLDNLVGNALQHTPPGGRVSLRLGLQGEQLQAKVVDTGQGIPSAELPFIFDRHFRGRHDQTERGAQGVAANGAGLGLAIAKRILELHGSDIGVECGAAAGTCFFFSLPLHTTAVAN